MEKFDVVIIGSGLGGLCCATILSKEGYSVCVLEKNRQLGGSLQIFSRDKAIFDTGIHYIGGLAEGQNLHQYFRYLGITGKLKLHRLDINGYDRITFAGDETEYMHAQGYDNFVSVLAERFPKEREAIRQYIARIREVCDFFPLYRLSREKKDLATAGFLTLNARDYINSVTANPVLRKVLAGSNPLYAGVGDATPFYVHALVVNTYIESAWRCIDGGAQIARHLARGIRQNGGVIRNYSQASKFHLKSDSIDAVELQNGELVRGKNFISNVDLTRTLQMIEGSAIRPAYRTRINSLANSVSVFIVNVVFKKEAFPYWNYNRYHYVADDIWSGAAYQEADWPPGLAMFTPLSSKGDRFTDSMTIMSYMRYDETAPWKDTCNLEPQHRQQRGTAYGEFKHKKAEKILDLVEARFPGFRNRIRSYTSSTPLTYRDYIGSIDGTLYGILKDCRDPLKTFISPRTRIPNLFLTGQNLNMHGVLGVTVSSVVTCSEFIGADTLIGKIKSA